MAEAFGIQSEVKPTVVYSEAQTYNADDDDNYEDNDVQSIAIGPDDRRILRTAILCYWERKNYLTFRKLHF